MRKLVFREWDENRESILSRLKGDPIMQTACSPIGRSSRVFAVSAKRFSAGPWLLLSHPQPKQTHFRSTLLRIYDKISPISIEYTTNFVVYLAMVSDYGVICTDAKGIAGHPARS
jgi:hypothetical protein